MLTVVCAGAGTCITLLFNGLFWCR